MTRPHHCRRVAGPPCCTLWKPAGMRARRLEEVTMGVDELEALRLADLEGLYQEEAAEAMGVSRPTFGRIIASARKKAAMALIEGRALRIEGGAVEMPEGRTFRCSGCGHRWDVPFGVERPGDCPECRSADIRRIRKESEMVSKETPKSEERQERKGDTGGGERCCGGRGHGHEHGHGHKHGGGSHHGPGRGRGCGGGRGHGRGCGGEDSK